MGVWFEGRFEEGREHFSGLEVFGGYLLGWSDLSAEEYGRSFFGVEFEALGDRFLGGEAGVAVDEAEVCGGG